MAPGVSAILLERLRRYRAEALIASGPLALRALQGDLAAIPVEATRDGALRRFHILLVCASVMKRDPANYSRAVGKAYDGLMGFLQDGESLAETRSPVRKPSLAPAPAEVPTAAPAPVSVGGAESATPFPPATAMD